MRRIIRPLATIAATALLSLAAISVAHADTGFDNGVSYGDETTAPPVAITKLLQVPTGTALPADGYFEFFAIPASVDGDSGLAAVAEAPELGNNPASANITPWGPDMISVKAHSLTKLPADPTQPGIDTYEVETLLPLGTADFPHAGVYVYDIKEAGYLDDGSVNFGDSVLTDNQTMKFSQADYTMTVYVENNTAGDGTFVSAVTVEQTANDSGTDLGTPGDNDTTDYPKVDPTPGTDNTNGMYSQMAFTNQYMHTNSTTDPLVDPPLAISKTVTGGLANMGQYFSFTVTLTDPSNLVAPDAATDLVPPFYRAYVVDNGAVIDPGVSNLDSANTAQIGRDKQGNSYIEVSTSDSTNFMLMNGQQLVFVDTPVGTGYTVTENSPTGYLPNYAITYNGNPGDTSSDTTIGQTLATGGQYVGESDNSADFTNNRDMITATGLTMDNLPFVGLIVVLVLAVVGYVVIKVRLRRRAA